VMRAARDRLHGRRLRGLVVVLWQAGLRIDKALALREPDLDRRRGSLLVRRGKGGRRREVGNPRRPATHRRARACAPPLRSPPATPRARRGDGRERVPLIVIQRQLGQQQPRHHLGLPAGHRERRNHRYRPHPPRPDDPRQHDTLSDPRHSTLTAPVRRSPAHASPHLDDPSRVRPPEPRHCASGGLDLVSVATCPRCRGRAYAAGPRAPEIGGDQRSVRRIRWRTASDWGQGHECAHRRWTRSERDARRRRDDHQLETAVLALAVDDPMAFITFSRFLCSHPAPAPFRVCGRSGPRTVPEAFGL
jgi:hypothetical protein